MDVKSNDNTIMRKLLLGIVFGVLFLSGCSTTADEPGTTEPKKTEFALGETAEIDGLKVTVNSVRYLEGDDIFSPDEGTKWIAVNFTFENTTDESIYVGGIYEITLKDSDGYEKELNIWGDVVGSVDGDVLPNEKLSGEKSFVVTGNEAALFVYYKPSFSSSEPLKFNIN